MGEVRPKLVLTTGTAGGIGKDFEVGDVVVSPVVRFDSTSWLKKRLSPRRITRAKPPRRNCSRRRRICSKQTPRSCPQTTPVRRRSPSSRPRRFPRRSSPPTSSASTRRTIISGFRALATSPKWGTRFWARWPIRSGRAPALARNPQCLRSRDRRGGNDQAAGPGGGDDLQGLRALELRL